MIDKWFDQETPLIKLTLSLIIMHLSPTASEAVQELLIAYEVKKQEVKNLRRQIEELKQNQVTVINKS